MINILHIIITLAHKQTSTGIIIHSSCHIQLFSEQIFEIFEQNNKPQCLKCKAFCVFGTVCSRTEINFSFIDQGPNLCVLFPCYYSDEKYITKCLSPNFFAFILEKFRYFITETLLPLTKKKNNEFVLRKTEELKKKQHN